MLENLLILPLALVIDFVIGEYPLILHPVEWIGRLISFQLKFIPGKNPNLQFAYGIFIVLLTVAIFSVPVFFLLLYLKDLSTIAYVIVAALLLKSTFSIRFLRQAAQKVRRLLDSGDIITARKETGYLVSRDTGKLGEKHIISAVVEMTSESITDSIVAPIFYWLILGVPGAIAYRVINTFDSRIGYHGEYEHSGKFAARLDDVINYIPARLAGIIMVISAYIARINGKKAWNTMYHNHRITASPNAGWTMSAVAGALGVQLEKIDHYRIGEEVKPLTLNSITDSLKLVALSSLIWCGICIVITGVYYAVAA